MTTDTVRLRLTLSGIVQGVGLRPFIHLLAHRHGLSGFVANSTEGVIAEVQGMSSAISVFRREMFQNLPPPARIHDVQARSVPCIVSSNGFTISASRDSAVGGIVPADASTCDECLREMSDAADRRFQYPFTTCCQCGPRYTIVRSLPFDRENTSMAAFAMCASCESEYRSSSDRRHHAQTIACPVCGPVLRFTNASGTEAARGDSAIDAARRCLAGGGIVAVKGLGGFHLVCDAANDSAVGRLRNRKERSDKPFAMMAMNVEIVRRYAAVGRAEERLLTGRERAIVLLRRSKASSPGSLSPLVAPNSNCLGFMLPYTPIHHLLVGEHPLVMTSGNVNGEPIVSDNDRAAEELSAIADAFLHHDRDIVASCDDSVIRVVEGRAYPIRRSRGYAPLPIPIDSSERSVLAVGGDLKGAVCLAKGGQAFLSPHLGDMENLRTLKLLDDTVERFRKLFRIEPDLVVCDRHPGYHTVRWAEEFAGRRGVPLVRVQHHRAHVASLLAECGRRDPIIGVCFDGTGYGDDGAIWGGEFFTGTLASLTRAAHLGSVPLPGGDASIERPYRMALAWLFAAGLAWDHSFPCVQACPPAEQSLLARQLERNWNCTPTSSVGRLFDAVAALIGVRQSATYEGQAAIELEAIVDHSETGGYDFDIVQDVPMVLDARPVIQSIVRDRSEGVSLPAIAARFHRGLTRAVTDICGLIRHRTGIDTVGLTGGVLQNVTLLELLLESLRREGFAVLIHRTVPANDGGLSLGQAALAMPLGEQLPQIR